MSFSRINTAQGFEFDYVGVIFCNDLVCNLDEQEWEGHPENSGDPVVRCSKDKFVDLVKNTYRVFLSRGLKGLLLQFHPNKIINGFSNECVTEHWLSEAVFDLLLYRNESSSAILALGMPDGFTAYLNLAARMDWLFKVLPFKIYWVDKNGHIRVQK